MNRNTLCWLNRKFVYGIEKWVKYVKFRMPKQNGLHGNEMVELTQLMGWDTYLKFVPWNGTAFIAR